LKVLLSAYACEPGKGSEPGMGWHWAVEITRLGHEVHILTRANNVGACERGLANLPGLRLLVHGYDLPCWARWWKKGQRGMHFYYVLWQWRAYRRARCIAGSTSIWFTTSPSPSGVTHRSWAGSAFLLSSDPSEAVSRRRARCSAPPRCGPGLWRLCAGAAIASPPTIPGCAAPSAAPRSSFARPRKPGPSSPGGRVENACPCRTWPAAPRSCTQSRKLGAHRDRLARHEASARRKLNQGPARNG
jgi:hypothetical protein